MIRYFVGIDVSKLTLDIAVVDATDKLASFKIDNSEAAVKALLLQLKAEFNCIPRNTIVCAEAMGIYNTFLLKVITKKKFRICLENPLRIKLSQGIQRGKSDAVDALRIARYASKHHHRLRYHEPPRSVIVELRSLSTTRKRLIKAAVMLSQSDKVEKYYMSKKEKAAYNKTFSSSLSALQADVAAIDQRIIAVIEEDVRLKEVRDIMLTIPRVGNVVATQLIITTNEFKDFASAKHFASYCGVAPFARSSGTSLNRPARVSHIANKEIKQLIHLAALGYTQLPKTFLGNYYRRKVEEGKNKMSILNAVRNKLIQLIFSCVQNMQPYQERYIYTVEG